MKLRKKSVKSRMISACLSPLLLAYSVPVLAQQAPPSSKPLQPTRVIDVSSYKPSPGDLQVNAGQSLVLDVSHATSGLHILGNLISNGGSIFAVSTLPSQTQASIFATNIVLSLIHI